jgi:hypothetical protein
MEERFRDNGDGTVTDACTGLMWQQRTADITGDGGWYGGHLYHSPKMMPTRNVRAVRTAF